MKLLGKVSIYISRHFSPVILPTMEELNEVVQLVMGKKFQKYFFYL